MLFVVCIDSIAQDYSFLHTAQEALMREFFRDIDESELLKIARGNLDSPVCGWPDEQNWDGVGSAFGVIENILYTGIKNHGEFRLEFLPQTVESIAITCCRQDIPFLNTRLLPRCAKVIDLRSNHIGGSLKLHTLPEGLEVFNMRLNYTTGPISLTNLPRKLRKLNFSHNRIRQSVIYYANLPETLTIVDLFCAGRIGSIKALYSDQKIKNKRIFDGMRRNQID